MAWIDSGQDPKALKEKALKKISKDIEFHHVQIVTIRVPLHVYEAMKIKMTKINRTNKLRRMEKEYERLSLQSFVMDKIKEFLKK